MMLFFLACGGENTSPSYPESWTSPIASADDNGLVALDPPRLLRRMSLDLRGILPTAAELDQVEADPGALATLRDAYLEDSRFEERFVDVLADRWATRVDEYLIFYFEYASLAQDPQIEYQFERSVADEPLRLMAHVAASDAPWSEIVTADYTFSNDLLAGIWPISYPGGTGWQKSYYTDGRPAAGILATNGLWWRYYTTVSNMNRGRAAMIARLLLCEDYLSRSVTFTNNVALVDNTTIEDALRTNPYCVGCHSSIDPLASSLFGFYTEGEYNGPEVHTYHPERELLGAQKLGVGPEWFGEPVAGLSELTWRLEEDPRFDRCAVESAAEMFWQRTVSNEDFTRVSALQEAYDAGGGKMKPLIRAVMETAVYQAGGFSDEATDLEITEEATRRMITAPLLSSVLKDLTGWEWWTDGYEQLRNDTIGFRVLGGGVDGNYVSRLQKTPGLTWALMLERAAEGAADYAVSQELEIGTDRKLFSAVTSTTPAGSEAFVGELQALHWRLYGVRAEDAWVESISGLWDEVSAGHGPTMAWRAVVSVMLRDPLFAGY